MNVKVFGERHTATNALQGFLVENFHTACYYYSFLGWKHRRAPRREEWQKLNYWNTLFIFTVRDPYTWARAMYREPYNYHHPQMKTFPFEQFLLHPLEDYENILKMWNEKYESYQRMLSEVPNGMLVRMEDFATDQRGVYEKAAKFLAPKGEFKPFEKYANGAGVSDRRLSPEETRPDLTPQQCMIINSQISPKLVQEFGYRILNPDELQAT